MKMYYSVSGSIYTTHACTCSCCLASCCLAILYCATSMKITTGPRDPNDVFLCLQ